MATKATVGNVEIQVFVDATPPPRDPVQLFPDVPLEKWAPYKKEHLDADGKFRTDMCVWLLRSGGRTILVDTGLGPGPHERLGGQRGKLMEHLTGVGVKPDDISTVVFTHLHGDHVGWNVTVEGGVKRLTFPKARYLVPQGDWDYFTRPEVMEKNPPISASVVPLKELGALDLVKGEVTITPEITLVPTPGHTPGHQAVLITSNGEKAMLVGDLFHTSVQVTEADWSPTFDWDKQLASETRRTWLDRLERERALVGAGHLPIGSNIGHIVRLKGRRYWQALP